MDPWVIYFVTYNSPLLDASYHVLSFATTSIGLAIGSRSLTKVLWKRSTLAVAPA